MPDVESREFGVFQLTEQLFISVNVLYIREVLPCQRIAEYIEPNAYVQECINVRGQIVPVLNLAVLTGHADHESFKQSVVILEFDQKNIGIYVQSVVDIFKNDATTPTEIRRKEKDFYSFFQHAIHIPQLENPIYELDIQRIYGLSSIPKASASLKQSISLKTDKDKNTLLLLRCGDIYFSIESDLVFTTVLNPNIDVSSLSSAYSPGYLRYSGLRIPIIKLDALIGFHHKISKSEEISCLILKLEKGFIALSVNDIIDITNIQVSLIVPSTLTIIPNHQLIAGVLPLAGHNFMHIDGEQIVHHSQIVSLSGINLVDDEKEASILSGTTNLHAMFDSSVMLYGAGIEIATKLEQIDEIVVWNFTNIISHIGPHTFLSIFNGKVATVFTLTSLLGIPPSESTHESMSVALLVKTETGYIGFIVERLMSIEQAVAPDAEEERSIPLPSEEQLICVDAKWDVIRLLHSAEKRMYGLLDLKDLAERIENHLMAKKAS